MTSSQSIRKTTVDVTGTGLYRAWMHPTGNFDADRRSAIRSIRRAIYDAEGTYRDTLATYYPHLRVAYKGNFDGRDLWEESD